MDLSGFLSAVVSLVRHHQRPGSGLNAAVLGNLIKSQAGLDWIDHGFPRLSDALLQLESAGEIRLVRDPRSGLVVFPSEPSQEPSSSPATPGTSATSGPIPAVSLRPTRPLKKSVWNAFVSAAPSGRRLLNKHSGEAWLTPDAPPEPKEDWVVVDAISADTQRSWARDFVDASGLAADREITEALRREDWFRIFPVLLTARRGPAIVGAWNRTRSGHVVRHVEAWAQRQNVVPEVFFDTTKAIRDRQTVDRVATGDLRRLLLDAIERMNVDDLLELEIPARHLIAAIRPELLDRR